MEEQITYKEFIDSIINTRGQWNIPQDEYYEAHHIIPKCMGGEPRSYHKSRLKHHPNIVWLFPQEHLEAHRLLVEENQKNYKLCLAYLRMCNKFQDEISLDQYKDSREKFSRSMMGHEVSEETREKIRNNTPRMNGPKNGMYGKKGEENPSYRRIKTDRERKILSEINKGKKLSEEVKQKIRDNAKVNKNFGMRGKHLSDETRKKLSKIKSNKPVVCLETNKKYINLDEASLDTGANKVTICLCCQGKRNTSGGYHWKYYGGVDENI